MNNIDKMMMNIIGSTGETKYDVPRVFDRNAYMTLYAELATEEKRAQAEALVLNNKLTQLKYKSEYGRTPEIRKAAGEGFRDIVHKVANAGRDLWRLIKKLLGKLIIFLEEQLHYIFDKSKVAEDLSRKMGMQLGRFKAWSRNGRFMPGYSNDGKEVLPDDLSRLVIDWFDNAAYTKFLEGKRRNASPEELEKLERATWDISSVDDIYNVGNLFHQATQVEDKRSFTDALEAVSQMSPAVALNKTIRLFKSSKWNKATKMRELAKDYKYIASRYKAYTKLAKDGLLANTLDIQFNKGKDIDDKLRQIAAKHSSLIEANSGMNIHQVEEILTDNRGDGLGPRKSLKDALGSDYEMYNDLRNEMVTPGAKVNDYRSAIHSVDHTGKDHADITGDDYIKDFVEAGALLEYTESYLKNAIFKSKVKLHNSFDKIVLEGNDYGEKVNEIYQTSKKILLCLILTVNNYRDMRTIYFDYKRKANELKNAPTAITDRYSKEVCQGVRTLISRSTRAAHRMLLFSNNIMSAYGQMASHASGVLSFLDKSFKKEIYADSVVDRK